MRVVALKGMNVDVAVAVVLAADLAAANAELRLRQHDDAAALRRLVGERGELRAIGEQLRRNPGHGQELDRLPVAERDRAGLVEQQRVDVARRLDGAAAHRDHVLLNHAVHARDADRREQAADRRRDEADEQRDQDRNRRRAAAVDGERLQRRDGEQEDDRQARQAESSARSRSASSVATRLRRARSCDRGRSRPGSP